MAGQSLAISSSDAWAAMGSQAEVALNSGWILDQAITSTGGFATVAAPSTLTAFLSSGDGTTGSGNGFWALGRRSRVVHTGGTAYAQVTAASYGAPVTTVTLGFYTGGTTSLSTVATASFSAAASMNYPGQLGNTLPGWVLLGESVLATSAATVDFTSISSGYRHLKLISKGASVAAAAVATIGVQFNGDTGLNYYYEDLTAVGATPTCAESTAAARGVVGFFVNGSTRAALFETAIPFYADTLFYKGYHSQSSLHQTTGSGFTSIDTVAGAWRSTAGINRVTVVISATSVGFSSGSIFSLYGIAGTL